MWYALMKHPLSSGNSQIFQEHRGNTLSVKKCVLLDCYEQSQSWEQMFQNNYLGGAEVR
jgi:hypothetical protein